MFGKKLSFYECKDYFITHIRSFDYTVLADTNSCFCVRAEKGSRFITITINNFKKGQVVVDITDSFGMLRIPKEKFSKESEYRMFIINSCTSIQKELNKQ